MKNQKENLKQSFEGKIRKWTYKITLQELQTQYKYIFISITAQKNRRFEN